MYLIYNEQTYEHVRMQNTSSSVRFAGDSLPALEELTGLVMVFSENGFELRAFDPVDYLRQEIIGGSWLLTNVSAPIPQPVVATPVAYDLNTSTAFAVKLLMSEKKPETADEIIKCSALWDEWEPEKHTVDEIFTVGGDPWKVYQSYDNAVNPDIAPGNQAWYTFNKPLHGTTRETAREFIQPQAGTVDIYHTGEWCIFEGKACKAKRDTNFSPKDYPADWEVEE